MEWYGILPITILVFVGLVRGIRALEQHARRPPPLRVVYLVAFAFLGVYVALMRDTIQIVRAFGDVMRVLLGVSLALEVLSGILLDVPIAVLGIQGDLAELGPIQGIFGSRNLLGFVALIALLTFIVEWRTQDRAARPGDRVDRARVAVHRARRARPPRGRRSAAALVALAALYGLRRAAPATRWRWQIALLVAAVVVLVTAWIVRIRIIELLDARAEFDVRLDVWRELSRYLNLNPLQGWGWVGSVARCRAVHLDRARHRPAARLGAQRLHRRLLPGRA